MNRVIFVAVAVLVVDAYIIEKCHKIDDDNDLDVYVFRRYILPERSQWYSTAWHCDGEVDCGNGVDEENCTSVGKLPNLMPSSFLFDVFSAETCIDPNRFFCGADKKCIAEHRVCDGVKDCADGQDELKCTELKCTTSSCSCRPNFELVPNENSCAPVDLCNENQYLCDAQSSGHQCINEPGGYSCKCADGYFNYDAKTCMKNEYKDVEPMVLCAQNNEIKLGKLNSMAQTLFDTRSLDDGFARLVEYNWHHNYVVFTTTEAVYAARLFKDKPSVIESEVVVRLRPILTTIRYLKLDWVHDLVFLMGESSTEVFHVKRPQATFAFRLSFAFALDPLELKLFYGTYDGVVGVDYSVLQHFDSKTALNMSWELRKGFDTSSSLPALAIDVVSKQLYLRDRKKFWLVDYAGNVVYQSVRMWCFYPRNTDGDISVFGEQLVVPDMKLLRAWNKYNCSGEIVFGKTDCFQPKLVHPSLQPMGEDKCAGSGCEGLCLPIASGPLCVGTDKSMMYLCNAAAL